MCYISYLLVLHMNDFLQCCLICLPALVISTLRLMQNLGQPAERGMCRYRGTMSSSASSLDRISASSSSASSEGSSCNPMFLDRTL